jgi:hypothetical protein
MKKKRIFRLLAILVISGIIIGGAIAIYLFNMPQRDIQASEVDYELTSTEIVNEYLNDFDAANQKYLASDGESKILVITGLVSNISEDFKGQKVILLKNADDKAGVNATLIPESDLQIEDLKIGDMISVKGVIRSGASYDVDLEMYENVILEKATIIEKK